MLIILSSIEINPEMISIFERFGIPMGILMVFSWFVAQSIRWFGSNVVVPMKDRHISFLDNLEKCLDKITDSQLKICDNTSSIRSDVDRIVETQSVIKQESHVLREKVDGLNNMVFQTMITNGKYDSKLMSSSTQDKKEV